MNFEVEKKNPMVGKTVKFALGTRKSLKNWKNINKKTTKENLKCGRKVLVNTINTNKMSNNFEITSENAARAVKEMSELMNCDYETAWKNIHMRLLKCV